MELMVFWFCSLGEWRSCAEGEYWIQLHGSTIHTALNCKRSFTIVVQPLPDWCEGIEKGLIVDVGTKDDHMDKFFKVVGNGRRKNISDAKYIKCEVLLNAPEGSVIWDCYKGQAHPGQEFNGRALFGRSVRSTGSMREGTITQYRQETCTYLVEFGNKQPTQTFKEQDLLNCLLA